MDSIVNVITDIPDGAYLAAAGGLGVSLLLEGFKKWLALQSDKIITFLLAAFSFMASAAEYLMTAVAENPTVLGEHTLVLAGSATILYRYVVKPGKLLLQDARAFRSSNVQNTTAALSAMPIDSVLQSGIEDETAEYIDDLAPADAVAPVAESEFPA